MEFSSSTSQVEWSALVKEYQDNGPIDKPQSTPDDQNFATKRDVEHESSKLKSKIRELEIKATKNQRNLNHFRPWLQRVEEYVIQSYAAQQEWPYKDLGDDETFDFLKTLDRDALEATSLHKKVQILQGGMLAKVSRDERFPTISSIEQGFCGLTSTIKTLS